MWDLAHFKIEIEIQNLQSDFVWAFVLDTHSLLKSEFQTEPILIFEFPHEKCEVLNWISNFLTQQSPRDRHGHFHMFIEMF